MKQLATLIICLLILSAHSMADNNSTNCPEQRPAICTMDYTPVCALNKDNTLKTYANACTACAQSEVVSYEPHACPERALSAAEVRLLFSGNTYEASIPSRKINMKVYVDPNGTMTGIQAGNKFSSKWHISEQGEICVSYGNKVSCRFVMEQDGQYKKYKLNEQGEKVVLVIYHSFTPGNNLK